MYKSPFHNSTDQSGEYLKQLAESASKQDDVVLGVFKLENRALTPGDVYRKYGPDGNKLLNCPLTSIRRAITNLTNKGLLRKTQVQKPGIYNRPENYWRLAQAQTTLAL